jgi:DNA-directed RNA polymerase specialized sigma24 family protein
MTLNSPHTRAQPAPVTTFAAHAHPATPHLTKPAAPRPNPIKRKASSRATPLVAAPPVAPPVPLPPPPARLCPLGPDLNAAARSLADAGNLLLPRDAALLHALCVQNQSVRTIARLLGRPVSTTRRSLSTLLRRVISPEFRFVVEERPRLPSRSRRVGHMIIIQGRSVREVADELGLSRYAVRRVVHNLRAMAVAPARRGAAA